MSRIQTTFDKVKKVFIGYVTAGFPSVDETVSIMNLLVESGVDVIELGYPFSDPAADGAAIQYSSQHALDNGFVRGDYFKILERFRERDSQTAIVAFGYYNPIFSYGVKQFVDDLKTAGADAMLIVDLPFEEQSEVRPITDEYGLDLIQLVAPSTDFERTQRILRSASGFIYQVSLRGVTGERESINTEVEQQTSGIREVTNVPVALGFGISNVQQIRDLIGTVDGIVIGSALVNVIRNEHPNYHESLLERAVEFATAIHS